MISVYGLHYQYPAASSPAIHDLNFEITKGEIFGFLGPSGAGKSTTQNILTKLLTGYQGEVGMQNRLSVARALLHRPELLFLDEPTSGLDPVNARTIKELIRRMRDEGATVFLTTHNMSVAEELCD